MPDSGRREFVCGWLAAFTETFVTYPLNKLIFRQQLHGIRAQRAWQQLRVEGLAYLYRGCLPPLIQKTCSRSIMFAGATEALMCPLERMQSVLQSSAYHGHYRNTWHLAQSLREYGLREYYRGVSAIVLRNGISNVLFFALRDPLRRQFAPDHTSSVVRRFMAAFTAGAMLGGCLSTLCYPLNVVKTHMQTRVAGRHLSILQVLVLIRTQRGGRLYRGVHLNFVRAVLTWGITNLVYDVLMHFTDESVVMRITKEEMLSQIDHAEHYSWPLD